MSPQRAQMLGVTLALLNLGGSGTTQNVERAAIGSKVRQADWRQTFVAAAAGDIACDPKDPSYNQGGGTVNRCHMRATALFPHKTCCQGGHHAWRSARLE